jgi:copper(I)-binding protein
MRAVPHAPPFLAAIAIGALMAASPALYTVAFADPPAASPAAAKPTIEIEAAWIRWLPAGLPAAGYLTLTNTGDKPLALDGASSPSYGDVSIHRSVRHGTTETMTPVKDLTLEPHQTVAFESTGYHLMLMRPATAVDTAARIRITLHFSDASSLTVPFKLRRNAPSARP